MLVVYVIDRLLLIVLDHFKEYFRDSHFTFINVNFKEKKKINNCQGKFIVCMLIKFQASGKDLTEII